VREDEDTDMKAVSSKYVFFGKENALYDYLPNWDTIKEQEGWEAYLDWCRRNENGPHE
jgi:hypothetical protein